MSKRLFLLTFLISLLIAVPSVAQVADVTGPGDTVKGVPDDGDWPGGEPPAYTLDDNSGTKYLHFKGPQGITGFQVTPSATSIVTGMTFTAANDCAGRDPVVFDLSGSNVSIDGPYELIAIGDIVDFNEPNEWPRFAITETEISFDNDVAYDHYQVIFPAIRGPLGGCCAHMQIAEVELLGVVLSAYKPSPAEGATVATDVTLSWAAGLDAVSHDVYFGTSTDVAFIGNQTGTSYGPGPLELGTTYYWMVDEVQADGTIMPGRVWSFKTTPPPSPVGMFEDHKDVGNPTGIGSTVYEGYVWKGDLLTEQYLISGGGKDIWNGSDQFHFAYNMLSGDVRITAGFEWVCKDNDWAKYGVMLRDPSADGPAVNYITLTRNNEDRVQFQQREALGAGSSEQHVMTEDVGAVRPSLLGIQRVTIEGLTWIQGLADWGTGSGWESIGKAKVSVLPDEIMVGVAVTSHENKHIAQARAFDVNYELNPSLVGDLGVITVPADAALEAPTSDVSGFKIRALKPLVTEGWGYDAMNEILDTGMWQGLPVQPMTEGTRISEFVNLRDTGNGVFSDDNGYPDETYPGIDPDETPAQDPAAGDDDDNFACEILGCIQLTAGLHFIGASSDDGTIIEIGGVEVGRTGEWKGTSNEDFLYKVEVDGYYNLRARHLEGGGGASIELHEIFFDGTRILLNDVANGGSAVFAPAE